MGAHDGLSRTQVMGGSEDRPTVARNNGGSDASATQALDTSGSTFALGGLVKINWSTTVGWTDTTSDLWAWLYVEM